MLGLSEVKDGFGLAWLKRKWILWWSMRRVVIRIVDRLIGDLGCCCAMWVCFQGELGMKFKAPRTRIV